MIFNITCIILFLLHTVNSNSIVYNNYNDKINIVHNNKIYSEELTFDLKDEPIDNSLFVSNIIIPTSVPTLIPTAIPTYITTFELVLLPTSEPTPVPTPEPTSVPTTEPTSELESNAYTKTNNSVSISKSDLIYILVFGILGIIILVYIFFRIYPKVNKYSIENIKKPNNEVEETNVITTLFDENENMNENNDNIKGENSDISKIIETSIEECNV